MPLYPTFEELKVDGLLKAQGQAMNQAAEHDPAAYARVADFMGLDLNSFQYNDHGELVPIGAFPQPAALPAAAAPAAAMYPPMGPASALPASNELAVRPPAGPIAIASPIRGEIQHGVNRIVLCKNADGKVGVQLVAINTGVFVSYVCRGSPAALGGLRFGDQILSICDVQVAGLSGTKAMDLLRKASNNNIEVIKRDRPCERTVEVNKSSTGDIGCHIHNGTIKQIVKNSSAARNGLLTEHQIVEVNGQNVVGLKDAELRNLLVATPSPLRLTILPVVLYKHMTKHLGSSQIRKEMDRSIPDA